MADAEAVVVVVDGEVAASREVVAVEVVAVFRGAAAAAFRGLVAEIFLEGVSAAPLVGLVREVCPAAREVAVWLLPEPPVRGPEAPASD